MPDEKIYLKEMNAKVFQIQSLFQLKKITQQMYLACGRRWNAVENANPINSYPYMCFCLESVASPLKL